MLTVARRSVEKVVMVRTETAVLQTVKKSLPLPSLASRLGLVSLWKEASRGSRSGVDIALMAFRDRERRRPMQAAAFIAAEKEEIDW